MASDEKYDQVTIVLHWTTAVGVAVLWIMGQTADWFPKGAFRTGDWSMHVLLGFALAVVIAWRIYWRLSEGRRLPAADAGVLRVLGIAAHYGLYFLLLVVIALGVANAFVRGYHLFGLVSLPQIGDLALRKPLTQWHGLAANVLLALAAIHAAAALFHHYVLRDSVLKRMSPAREV